jgi:hypothetical protein
MLIPQIYTASALSSFPARTFKLNIMNNQRRLLPFVLITVFLFSACNSSLSITKRRYTKGYYIHHPSAPNALATENLLKKNHKQTATTKEQNTVAAENEALASITGPQSPAAASPQKSRTTNAKTPERSLAPSEFITQPVKSFTALKKQIEAHSAVGEALSLLWLLVVILLVVYIAGLLFDNFGAGWIIHLLLVAALVMFILWLLRIL